MNGNKLKEIDEALIKRTETITLDKNDK